MLQPYTIYYALSVLGLEQKIFENTIASEKMQNASARTKWAPNSLGDLTATYLLGTRW